MIEECMRESDSTKLSKRTGEFASQAVTRSQKSEPECTSQIIHEQNAELKEKIKDIENGIMEQINVYNENIKDYNAKYETYKDRESHGFLTSQKMINAIKAGKDYSKIDTELIELNNNIDFARIDVMSAQKKALMSLQNLYKEHVDYLVQVIKGLQIRCENLEANNERSDNIASVEHVNVQK